MNDIDKELFELMDMGTRQADMLTSLKSPIKFKHKIKIAFYDNVARIFKSMYKIFYFSRNAKRLILGNWIGIEKRRLETENEIKEYLKAMIESKSKK